MSGSFKVFKERVRAFKSRKKYRQLRGVIWFVVLTLVIHYSYRFWANRLFYFPVRELMSNLQETMTGWVYHQSVWVNQHILGIGMTMKEHIMFFANGCGISINSSCAGDKQILQFALLMLVYPGPWKHKVWYIPTGMVLVHMTNILRIVLLSVVAINEPGWMKIAHDTALRGMFYIVIFALWVVWEERFRRRGEEV